MNDIIRLDELASLFDAPDGVQQIADLFDNIRNQVGDDCPTAISVQGMIEFVAEFEPAVAGW